MSDIAYLNAIRVKNTFEKNIYPQDGGENQLA